ncbi:MAG: sensor histidine kinase, partial [Gemmatimonadetes bacterium]|nr:sensor histidine kinase [Gemmatimonadota bacterium]
MDAVASLTLYRIVQEAVTNAVKHSGAGEAAVTLRTANGWIEVVGVASSGEEAVRK